MNVQIAAETYRFVPDAMRDAPSREAYFRLVRETFGLDFQPWHQSGFCDGSFIPYTLFRGGDAVSSVGVVAGSFQMGGVSKKYVQISTVATAPGARRRGLSGWLMETVLNEWRGKCDGMYLYANDSVVDFYPKFGFVPARESRYRASLTKRKPAPFRKLCLSAQSDVDLLVEKHGQSNPFSLLTRENGAGILMFHCLTFLSGHIYYLETYDTVIIAKQEEGDWFCYDLYGGAPYDMMDLLRSVAPEDTRAVTLGFTPKSSAGFTVESANEEGTNCFVLRGKENIWAGGRITVPFLSRA